METFIKENWFKISLLVFLFVFLVLLSLVYTQLNSKINSNNSERDVSTENKTISIPVEKEVLIDEKADDYVVLVVGDTALDWKTIDRAWVIMDDSVTTYKEALSAIKDTQKTEEENVNKMYAMVVKTEDSGLKALLKYEQVYLDAGAELISLLDNLIKNYNKLHESIQKRDPVLYRYYSDEITKLSDRKVSSFDKYTNAEKSKQDFAKSLLEN